uniref:Expansin-like EG45 domain-containing protein n=1 Tax=Physcomitrium patens TaxID=3218 RepID=A0A7I4FF82_PHYPA
MGSSVVLRQPTVLLWIALASVLPVAHCSGSLEASGYTASWLPGHATWYGDPYGEGSSGGACGYTELAGTPYGLSVGAGSAVIYQNGQGCGECYEVKCTYPSCKPTPSRIVITDFCPGGTFCSTGEPAFDLSGMAMTNMALPGRDQELRNLGLYEIQYRRVPCYYPNQNVAFKVDPGSTPFWLSFTIEYQGGPGDIESVAIRQGC